jgi:hypothetical protein
MEFAEPHCRACCVEDWEETKCTGQCSLRFYWTQYFPVAWQNPVPRRIVCCACVGMATLLKDISQEERQVLRKILRVHTWNEKSALEMNFASFMSCLAVSLQDQNENIKMVVSLGTEHVSLKIQKTPEISPHFWWEHLDHPYNMIIVNYLLT